MTAPEPVRVMVIDDQADVRFLIGIILEEHPDIEVVADVDGGEAALAMVAESAPDVVLLDARMPGMDGFELAPRLLERAPSLRIAMLTSVVDEVIEQRAAAAGAEACVSKEDIEHLPELVRQLAAR